MSAFWYDGQWIEPAAQTDAPLDNAGLRFGATVFTTLRVYGRSLSHPLTLWDAHCDRLKNSVEQFGWTHPNWKAIYAGAQRALQQHLVLRITLFPDGREWIAGRSLPTNLETQQQRGVSAWLAPHAYSRSLPTHKTGNYLACWLAKSEAQAAGAAEAVLVNAQGDWLETSTGNLWGWKDNCWWTPKTDNCLPGIMRNWLLDRLLLDGERVDCRPWDSQMSAEFEAIAYSNCIVQLLPIHTIASGQTKLNYNAQHASIQALRDRISAAAQEFASN